MTLFDAGDATDWPTALRARTVNVCAPAVSPVIAAGDAVTVFVTPPTDDVTV